METAWKSQGSVPGSPSGGSAKWVAEGLWTTGVTGVRAGGGTIQEPRGSGCAPNLPPPPTARYSSWQVRSSSLRAMERKGAGASRPEGWADNGVCLQTHTDTGDKAQELTGTTLLFHVPRRDATLPPLPCLQSCAYPFLSHNDNQAHPEEASRKACNPGQQC